MPSEFPMFRSLTQAFTERADAMGKLPEAQSFIASMQKECPTWTDYERALILAWADGLMYGNWPWVKI